MGLLSRILHLIVIAITVIYFAPGLPPHFDFQPFRPSGVRELKGPLAPNAILDKAVPVEVDKEILNPESVAIRGDEVYTGLGDGRLVRIKDGKVTNVGSLGVDCDNADSNKACGRVAGIRFNSKGKLLAANVGLGIQRIDVDTGEVEQLVPKDTVIDGKPPKFPNDVDEDAEGNIYWSDSSTIATVEDLMLEAFAGPSGRFLRYNPKTKGHTVLINNLHFANGVQVSKNGDFVLVAELFGARVRRYHLKGEKQGQHDIFIEDLPGLPDNIRPNGKGGFYITLMFPRPLPKELSLCEKLGDWPLTRRFLVRLQYLLLKLLNQAQTFFPSPILEEWIIKVRWFGMLDGMVNVFSKAIVVETDGDGNIIGSLQNEKGPITRMSEISVGKTWAYLASPSMRQLYKLKVSDMEK